jgi:putative toxin-antitoxin system antitoxin component (TIGR02293 family)
MDMIALGEIAGILGIEDEVRTLSDLDSAVSRGLPKQSVVRLVSRIALTQSDQRSLRDQLIPPATWKRTTGRLSRQASERTERMARVMAHAEYVLDDPEIARRWMNAPHPELNGRTPFAAAATELGARSVEYVLDSLFYGLPI